MSDVTSRIHKYNEMFERVAGDLGAGKPLLVDSRFIRAVAMAFAELDERVERVMQTAERQDVLFAELTGDKAKGRRDVQLALENSSRLQELQEVCGSAIPAYKHQLALASEVIKLRAAGQVLLSVWDQRGEECSGEFETAGEAFVAAFGDNTESKGEAP